MEGQIKGLLAFVPSLSVQSFYMKTDMLEIRVQPAEKLGFQEAAEIAGIPLSAWVRERLRRAARIELIEAHRSVPFAQHQWSKANG